MTYEVSDTVVIHYTGVVLVVAVMTSLLTTLY
jgi:hypothetical protein